jgi:preprotein translocase subunit SecA
MSRAVERFLDPHYGAASFAEFAANRLGVEFETSDFNRSDFAEAEKTARDKAFRAVETQIIEMIEENLGTEDSKEWNWQALSHQANTRWGLSTNDRQLKQIGKDDLTEYLREKGNQAVSQIDLSEGRAFLEGDWGIRSLCDWARLKFQIKVSPEELTGKSEEEVENLLRERIMELYRQKEIAFPVMASMVRHMADRPQASAGGQRYDREGLYRWALARYPQAASKLSEEHFRTESRARLLEMLLEVSRETFPKVGQEAIDVKLEEAMHGTALSEAEDAKELSDWARAELGVEVPEADLTGVSEDQARQILWNAFDAQYRGEMRRMERSLLLNQLDMSWKNHLYSMDHLRSGIGLVGYAQEDPKTAYKREGMKEFRSMWEGVEDKITETVFRVEETEAFAEAVWMAGTAVHEAAPRVIAADNQVRTNSGQSDKKVEPIRNRGEKVGRNDPCPCGSGKKYKACHMRQAAGA